MAERPILEVIADLRERGPTIVHYGPPYREPFVTAADLARVLDLAEQAAPQNTEAGRRAIIMSDPIEAAVAARREGRGRYMVASGPGAANRPSRVYAMVGAHEEDTPCFVGADDDCFEWIEARIMPDAVAAYLRARITGHQLCHNEYAVALLNMLIAELTDKAKL